MKVQNIAMAAFAALVSMNGFAANIATVGGKGISADELRTEYAQITDEQRAAINKDSTTRRGLVENAINSELLYQAAVKSGLEKDSDYQKAMEHFKKQYLASRFMQKAIEPKLDRSDVKKFYETNKFLFDTSQVCAEHIVVSSQDEAQKISDELKKAMKGKNAKADSKIFEQYAVKHSIDPTVQENKGDLGCFTRDRMVPEFAAAAFNMKKFGVSGPVHTMFGYHVIRVTDMKQGRVVGFDEVEQKAKDTYRMKLMQDTLQDLRSKSSVSINEEAVKDFKL